MSASKYSYYIIIILIKLNYTSYMIAYKNYYKPCLIEDKHMSDSKLCTSKPSH